MITFDTIIGLLAPHTCLGCSQEGSQLCDDCIANYFHPIESKCAGCFQLSKEFKVCKSCKSWLPLKKVIITCNYDGIYEKLLKEFKFNYKRQNAKAIANMMSNLMGGMEEYIICPIPTAPARIRMRGFDHVGLLAKNISKFTGVEVQNYLKRKSNVRQLGSSRKQRIEHMQNEFYISGELKGKRIIVLDDVMTSGATLAAAAKVLKKAGAREVSAIVFARQIS